MRLVFTENVHALKLPEAHRFPIAKYARIHSALASEHADLMRLGAPATWDDIALVHDRDYVASVRDGRDPGNYLDVFYPSRWPF